MPAGVGVVKIWGTQPDKIDEAEDRDRWMALLERLEIRQPPGGVATNEQEALAIANGLTYPCMVRRTAAQPHSNRPLPKPRQSARPAERKLSVRHGSAFAAAQPERASWVCRPLQVRPSFVLGGRAMEIVYSDADIHRYVNTASAPSSAAQCGTTQPSAA